MPSDKFANQFSANSVSYFVYFWIKISANDYKVKWEMQEAQSSHHFEMKTKWLLILKLATCSQCQRMEKLQFIKV
jgi:hypothetical protein